MTRFHVALGVAVLVTRFACSVGYAMGPDVEGPVADFRALYAIGGSA